jgi:hypothetical protein
MMTTNENALREQLRQSRERAERLERDLKRSNDERAKLEAQATAATKALDERRQLAATYAEANKRPMTDEMVHQRDLLDRLARYLQNAERQARELDASLEWVDTLNREVSAFAPEQAAVSSVAVLQAHLIKRIAAAANAPSNLSDRRETLKRIDLAVKASRQRRGG